MKVFVQYGQYGTLLASVNSLTNYASATADTAVFSALRLLGAQGHN